MMVASMLVPDAYIKRKLLVKMLLVKMATSSSCNQHISSPTFITNIDVTKFAKNITRETRSDSNKKIPNGNEYKFRIQSNIENLCVEVI